MTRLIPIDELVRIVTEAGLLHQRGFYETSLSHLIVRGGDPFGDVSTALELAGSLGIPEERVMAAIEKWYPSVESQLTALEAQGAVATTRAVASTYQVELLQVLREALPSVHFDGELETANRVFDQPHLDSKWRRDYRVRLFVVKQAPAPGQPGRGWRQLFGLRRPAVPAEPPRSEVLLATVQVGNELVAAPDAPVLRPSGSHLYRGKRLHIVITVGSGVFIKLCGETLTALRHRFGAHNGIAAHEVCYDYVVQEADQLG
jgi:hypothetical protein